MAVRASLEAAGRRRAFAPASRVEPSTARQDRRGRAPAAGGARRCWRAAATSGSLPLQGASGGGSLANTLLGLVLQARARSGGDGGGGGASPAAGLFGPAAADDPAERLCRVNYGDDGDAAGPSGRSRRPARPMPAAARAAFQALEADDEVAAVLAASAAATAAARGDTAALDTALCLLTSYGEEESSGCCEPGS